MAVDIGMTQNRKFKETAPVVERRSGAFRPSSFSAEDRSVDIVLSTGARIRKWDWNSFSVIEEELSLDPAHLRSSRMGSERGIPYLKDHYQSVDSVIGRVRDANIGKGEVTGKVTFGARADEALVSDIRDGILGDSSIGYRVYEYQITKREGVPDLYRAVDWEIVECSLVAVPADAGAGTRSSQEAPPAPQPVEDTEPVVPAAVPQQQEENRKMADPNNAAADAAAAAEAAASARDAATRAQAIKDMQERNVRLTKRATDLGLGAEIVLDISSRGLDDAAAFDALAEARKRKDEAVATQVAAETAQRGLPAGHITGVKGGERSEKDAQGIIDIIAHRTDSMNHPMTDNAKRFIGMDTVTICRHVLATRGVDTMGMPKDKIVRAAMQVTHKRDIGGVHTTSDFPDLLGDGVMNRLLMKAYDTTPDEYKQWTTEVTFGDTRPHYYIRMGGLPNLRKVGEAEEYKRTTLGTTKEAVNIDKRGEIFGLSLEAMINDDLSAFARLPVEFGRSAKYTESAAVYQLLIDNPTMSDGYALFSSQHANIGTASAPDVTGITDARTLMRKQTDPGSGQRLGVRTAQLLIPYKYELGLAQIVAPALPAAVTAATIVPQYIKDTKYTVSDQLDANSAQVWYAVADPQRLEGVVVARLEGAGPFQIEQKEGWNVDGMEWKIRHWFGVGVIDSRGLYRNPGV